LQQASQIPFILFNTATNESEIKVFITPNNVKADDKLTIPANNFQTLIIRPNQSHFVKVTIKNKDGRLIQQFSIELVLPEIISQNGIIKSLGSQKTISRAIFLKERNIEEYSTIQVNKTIPDNTIAIITPSSFQQYKTTQALLLDPFNNELSSKITKLKKSIN